MKGGVHMKYQKPQIKKMTCQVKVNQNASELSSCDGGHCVRARYSGDH